MKKSQRETHLYQLGQALRSQVEDTLTCDHCQSCLPDYVATEMGEMLDPRARLAVETHLALCPHCREAMLELQQMLSDSLVDAIPTAGNYPNLDLAFLSQPMAATSSLGFQPVLATLRQQGKQFLTDALGAIYVLLNPTPISEGAWAVKSSDENLLLARTVLSEDELPGWEIEATAYAVDGDFCRVEVSAYTFEQAGSDLSGIVVTLNDGVQERTASSDANGLVEFEGVRRDRLESIVIGVVRSLTAA